MHKFGINPFILTNEDAAINMKRMSFAEEKAYASAEERDYYRMVDMQQARHRGAFKAMKHAVEFYGVRSPIIQSPARQVVEEDVLQYGDDDAL